MRVGLVGGRGYIGEFLQKELLQLSKIEQVQMWDKKKSGDTLYMDLEHLENFDFSNLSQVDCIIILAAVSSPDVCARDFESSWRINVEGTITLISAAIERSIRVLFFSSDAVFGPDTNIFYEDSETNASTAYGKMKKVIEDTFKANSLFKAIRLSYVVSSSDRFIRYCLDCIKKGSTADVYHPFYRNCITVTNVVEIVVWLLLHWDTYSSWVLNAAGSELVSRLRLADELNRILEGRLQYLVRYPGDEFYTNRPAITQMKSKFLYELEIIPELSFSEAFRIEMQGVLE